MRPSTSAPRFRNVRTTTVAWLGITLHGLASAVPAGAVPPAREFRIDSSHSRVGFSIPFLGSHVRGQFDEVKGIVSFDPELSKRTGVTVTIAAASLHTGSAHRDEHLRSSDFFDVGRYPAIAFRSEEPACAAGSCTLTGALTLHGVTKMIQLQVAEAYPPTQDPHGSTLILFNGKTRLARKDFGILGGSRFNSWFDELRSRTMGDSVDIELEISGFAIDYDRTRANDAALARVEKNGVAPLLARMTALAPHPDSLAGWPWDIEQLGLALIQKGKTDEGLAVLRRFAEVLPDTATSHGMLARGYELAGQPDSARLSARRALASKPDDPRSAEVLRRLR